MLPLPSAIHMVRSVRNVSLHSTHRLVSPFRVLRVLPSIRNYAHSNTSAATSSKPQTPSPASPSKSERPMNEHITCATDKILLLNERGEKQGIVSLRDQLRSIDRNQFNLVQVGQVPELQIPLCKLMAVPATANITTYSPADLDKTKKKKAADAPKKLKKIQFKVNIGEHDLQVWMRKAKELLEKGHAVKVVVETQQRKLKFELHEGKRTSELELLKRVQARLVSEDKCALVSIEPQRDNDRQCSMVLRSKLKSS